MLSPLIFLLVIDWVMKTTISNNESGIQWTLMQHLEDLDLADDICLLSHTQQNAQSKLNRLEVKQKKRTSNKQKENRSYEDQ